MTGGSGHVHEMNSVLHIVRSVLSSRLLMHENMHLEGLLLLLQ